MRIYWVVGWVVLQGVFASLQAESISLWEGSLDNDLANAGNWTPALPPQPPTVGDVAIFPADASSFAPELTGGTFSLYQVEFASPAPSYEFSVSGGSTLVFGVSGDSSGFLNGIVPPTTGELPRLRVTEGSVIQMTGTASAAQPGGTGAIYSIGPITSGCVWFRDQASGGVATFNVGGDNTAESSVSFWDTSSASQATILLSSYTPGYGVAAFNDQSTAGTAMIAVGDPQNGSAVSGALRFFNAARAGAAAVSVGDVLGKSTVTFNDTATADQAVITVSALGEGNPAVSGTVEFRGTSTAGNAALRIGDVAGLTLSSGQLHFYDNATAGVASIHVGDHLGGSRMTFNGSSQAGSANILIGTNTQTLKGLDGTLWFTGTSDAGDARITASDADGRSAIYFQDSSSAGSSYITLGNPTEGFYGQLEFQSGATAANANILATNGSTVTFASGSFGANASLSLTTGGAARFLGAMPFTVGALALDPFSTVVLPDGAAITINYEGQAPTTIAGQVTGNLITKAGSGPLVVNGIINANLTLADGTLSGTGRVTGNVTGVGGVFSPGNSPGTFIISGNYTQGSSSTYVVQIEDAAASLLQIEGSATLDNAPLQVLADKTFLINYPYLVLQARNGITGHFAPASFTSVPSGFNPALLIPLLSSWSDTQIFLALQTAFGTIAQNHNQRVVAKRLDAFINPEARQHFLLMALLHSHTEAVQKALSQLSGESYADWGFIQDRTVERIHNSLYEPLRPMLVSGKCAACQPIVPITVWVDGGVGRSFLDSQQGSTGLSLGNYDMLLGMHGKVATSWTVGGLVSYEHNHISYNVGGYGNQYNWMGGPYSLFRPSHFYWLTQGILGYGKNHVHRSLTVREQHEKVQGEARVLQVSVNSELGFDIRTLPILFQPFANIRASHDHLHQVQETGSHFMALNLFEQNRNVATSRLGLHTTLFPEACRGFCGFDVAWQCLLTAQQEQLRAQFQAFGTPFTVLGVPLARNSVEGAVFGNLSLASCYKLFARLSGQLWQGESSYDLLIGLEGSW